MSMMVCNRLDRSDWGIDEVKSGLTSKGVTVKKLGGVLKHNVSISSCLGMGRIKDHILVIAYVNDLLHSPLTYSLVPHLLLSFLYRLSCSHSPFVSLAA